MNTKKLSCRFVSTFRRLLLAMIVVAVLLSSLPARAAHAWTYSNTQGRVGNVSYTWISVADLWMPSGYRQFTLLGDRDVIVSRVPSYAGAQIIGVIYSVQKWNGSQWVAVASSPTLVAQLSATQQSARFVRPYLQPQVAKGYFRFVMLVTWFTSSSVLLGNTLIVPNLASDHKCVTRVRFCQSYPGYVLTGGSI